MGRTDRDAGAGDLMCWECGGRCVYCGEPSTTMIIAHSLSASILACDEHKAEAESYAYDYLMKLEAAPWN